MYETAVGKAPYILKFILDLFFTFEMLEDINNDYKAYHMM